VIGWPGEASSSGGPGNWIIGGDFLQGQSKEGILPSFEAARLSPSEIHLDVLESLVPRWREATSDQNETLHHLRNKVAELYSTFRIAKAVHAMSEVEAPGSAFDNRLFLAINHDFLTFVEHTFGKFAAPRTSEIDAHDWALFEGLPDRALGLLDILIGDLMRTFGPDTKALIVFEPAVGEYSWNCQYGTAVVRGAWDSIPQRGIEYGAEEIAALLYSEAKLPPVGQVPVEVELSRAEMENLKPEAAFHGGLAFASSGQWAQAQKLFEKAWKACPENPYHALELARARHNLSDRCGARQALETALDFGELPEFARELTFLVENTNESAELELRLPQGSEMDRLRLLAGPVAGYSEPVRFLVLVTRGPVQRIVGGAALEEMTKGRLGRVRVFLNRRWQGRKKAVKFLVEGVTAEARRLEWKGCHCEIFDAADFAATLSELGYGLAREDQRWRVPFAGVYPRALSAWQLIEKRGPDDFVNFAGEPQEKHWQAAREIAHAHRLLNGSMVQAMSSGEEARKAYRLDLCHFILKGDELAAVLLSRSLSPTRVFVELRAVAPKFHRESRRLNAELMLRVLMKGHAKNVEAYELLARRREEAETIAMARRSGGVCLHSRHVFEWSLTSNKIREEHPAPQSLEPTKVKSHSRKK
jgi:tetratricopeptide (TPR) repeat protein